MNQRELAAELIRLKQMAKALLSAIDTLSARVDGLANAGPATVPPPARPTTRIRRVLPGNARNAPTESPPRVDRVDRDDPPSTKPGTSTARGQYRYVPPTKKR